MLAASRDTRVFTSAKGLQARHMYQGEKAWLERVCNRIGLVSREWKMTSGTRDCQEVDESGNRVSESNVCSLQTVEWLKAIPSGAFTSLWTPAGHGGLVIQEHLQLLPASLPSAG